MNDKLYHYYLEELQALREQGELFAKQYPELASNLAAGQKNIADPNTARLIESLALLNARVAKKLDDHSVNLNHSLLTGLYPECLFGVPSMGIVALKPRADVAVCHVAKGSLFEVDPAVHPHCLFQTGHALGVLPLEVRDVYFQDDVSHSSYHDDKLAMRDVMLSMHFQPLSAEQNLAALKPKKIRFYLAGGEIAYAHYHLLKSCYAIELAQANAAAALQRLQPCCLQSLGMTLGDQLLIAQNPISSSAMLLLESFVFPQKFLYFDLSLDAIEDWQPFADSLHIRFKARMMANPLLAKTRKDHVILNTTPVVNLFEDYLDPIKLAAEKIRYPLIAHCDKKQYGIYKVNQVDCVLNAQQSMALSPMYDTALADNQSQACWQLLQDQSGLSLEEEGATAQQHACLQLIGVADLLAQSHDAFLQIKAYCHNHHMPRQLFFTNHELPLQFFGASPAVEGTRWLVPPSRYYQFDFNKSIAWVLNKHLSLNFTSLLQDNGESLKALLHLWDYTRSAESKKLIEAIKKITTEQVTEMLDKQGRSLVVYGMRINFFVAIEPFLMGRFLLMINVLHQFLGFYVSINSFVSLTVLHATTEEEIYRCPAQAGCKNLV